MDSVSEEAVKVLNEKIMEYKRKDEKMQEDALILKQLHEQNIQKMKIDMAAVEKKELELVALHRKNMESLKTKLSKLNEDTKERDLSQKITNLEL